MALARTTEETFRGLDVLVKMQKDLRLQKIHLALLLDVDVSNLSKILRGKLRPYVSLLKRVDVLLPFLHKHALEIRSAMTRDLYEKNHIFKDRKNRFLNALREKFEGYYRFESSYRDTAAEKKLH